MITAVGKLTSPSAGRGRGVRVATISGEQSDGCANYRRVQPAGIRTEVQADNGGNSRCEGDIWVDMFHIDLL